MNHPKVHPILEVREASSADPVIAVVSHEPPLDGVVVIARKRDADASLAELAVVGPSLRDMATRCVIGTFAR